MTNQEIESIFVAPNRSVFFRLYQAGRSVNKLHGNKSPFAERTVQYEMFCAISVERLVKQALYQVGYLDYEDLSLPTGEMVYVFHEPSVTDYVKYREYPYVNEWLDGKETTVHFRLILPISIDSIRKLTLFQNEALPSRNLNVEVHPVDPHLMIINKAGAKECVSKTRSAKTIKKRQAKAA